MKAPLETFYLLYKRNRIKAISLWPDGKKQSHVRKTMAKIKKLMLHK